MSSAMLNAVDTFGEHFVDASELLGRYEATEQEAADTVRLLGLGPSDTVVEAGCGPGRFAQALASHGCRVIGVDISPQVVALARQRHPGPDYRVLDMADLPPGCADALVNVYSSFGYSATPEEDAEVLRAWWSALRPGGRLLLELSDLERAKARLGEEGGTVHRETNGVREELRMDWQQQMLHVTYRIGDRRLDCRTRIYSRGQLVEGLRAAGFTEVDCFGGFDGREKTPEDRLVLVARR
ncbi:methyltransferase domain-containing protein [Streptomyces sp. PRKS01-65]|nr:class I SAM-dependent methyltransferase [Streptomyces harenosi]NEY30953.1 methyltransferase domain-containing protein [Streptomyces harenosi]